MQLWSIYLFSFVLVFLFNFSIWISVQLGMAWKTNGTKREPKLIHKHFDRGEKLEEQVSCIRSCLCVTCIDISAWTAVVWTILVCRSIFPTKSAFFLVVSVWFAYRIQIQLEKFFVVLFCWKYSIHHHFLSVYPFDGQCCCVVFVTFFVFRIGFHVLISIHISFVCPQIISMS